MLPLSFARIPRLRLAHTPTPIKRTSSTWDGHQLFIKRDDLTGCALSGNKVRKLEYLFADARQQGADTMLTCGGVQSNCARALAVASAMTGFRSTLILTGAQPERFDGNHLLDRLVGADIHLLPKADASARDEELSRQAERLRSEGRTTYVVPFGGSSEVGVLGYVRAAFEIASQLGPAARNLDRVVVPVASGGTLAGLHIGFKLAGIAVRLTGMYVEEASSPWAEAIPDLVMRTADRFGFSMAPPIEGEDIELVDARGAGYGKPSEDELRFIASCAQDAGLLLDPVYTGKAMFAFDRGVREGALSLRGDVLFIHTGGVFGIFPHADALVAATNHLDGAESGSPGRRSRPVRVGPLNRSSPHRRSIASP